MIAVAVPSLAHADDGASELAQVRPPVPEKGVDQAPVRPPRWCARVTKREPQWGYTVKGEIESFRPDLRQHDKIIEAAELVCTAPNSPMAARAAAMIEQLWINETGQSDAEAVASLAARVDKDGFEAARDKFCEGLPEVSHEPEQWFASARRQFFGCQNDAHWMGAGELRELREYLDRGPVEADPILRLAWALSRLHADLFSQREVEHRLAGYAIDQFDIHLAPEAALKQLDSPPYRGNDYARIIMIESIARERQLAARLEALVADKARDPNWNELLIGAPRRGWDAWQEAARKHKQELAAADAVGRDDGSSGRVDGAADDAPPAGCEDQLRAALAPMVKKAKADRVTAVSDELSRDPLAGYLFHQLAQCMRRSGAGSAADWIGNVAFSLRYLPGPRTAAFFETVDMIAAMKRRAPFDPRDLTDVADFDRERSDLESHATQGVIASASKVKGGVRLVFVQHKFQVMDQECHEGSKVDHVDSSGHFHYRQECHPTGHMSTVSNDPNPVVVPTRYAAALAPGRFIQFYSISYDREDRPRGRSHGREQAHESGGDPDAFPTEIYADKVGKKLIGFYSFSL